MDGQIFQNLTNQTKPFYEKQPPSMIRTYTANMQESVTPLVVRHNPKKSSPKLMSKKSSKKFMPKYLYNPPYAVQKQKLLYQIQKENLKLRHQHAINKNLQKKLQKKLVYSQKKAESVQKLNKTQIQSIQGIQRTITSSLQKPFTLQPNKNFIKSIKNQTELLEIQIKKNQEAILKMKQSKKYTRYIENQEEKNTFHAELVSMKKYKKKLKFEINKLKRIRQEKKNFRIKELILQGEIQNSVEMENIQIYNLIQDIKENLKSTTFKKATLLKKKNILLQQIEQLKERHNISDEFIEANFKPNLSQMSMTNSQLSYYRSFNSTQYRTVSNQLNNLGSLQQEEEEDDSMISPHYQKVKLKGHTVNNSEDAIRQKATCTVKIHSNVNSDDGEFTGIQGKDQLKGEKHEKRDNERSAMEKLDQKYFYEDENFESEDEISDREYDSQEYDGEDEFESEVTDEKVSNLKSNQKSRQKDCGVPPQEKGREKQWNSRQARGVSI